MSFLALPILLLILWSVARMLLYRAEAAAERRRLDELQRAPQNVYRPPEAPLAPGDAPAGEPPAIDPVVARRLKGAMEGIAEALPLGAQPGWQFGPPPPAAEVEPEPDDHHVSLNAEEIARMRPPDPE